MPITSSISFLRTRLSRAPRTVLVLGSGLGSIEAEIQDAVRISYDQIPGFPPSTVAGHAGALIVGIHSGVEVAVLSGRFHLYEGAAPGDVALPMRALAALGAKDLVVTNAAGGIRPGMAPGDLMLMADHLNLTFRNPLIGGVAGTEDRFPDMSDPYDAEFRRIALRTADELGIGLVQGVYAAVLGPSYETPAEIRMLARMGADAVGMSTVPEVMVAQALGMRVLGISCITNVAASVGGTKLSHDEVLAVGAGASSHLARLLRVLLPRIVPSNLPTEAAS
ncbi:MAG: purine-nucleoside phosphorylase [Gemmatimonas sp.]|nr:purine-nucleoside phosphorylase [Gemmatimonas sp.]